MTSDQLTLSTRPPHFGAVIGQPCIRGIVSACDTAIAAGTVPQGMLLAGPHGCGKTSTGRLIAKYLNCDNPKADTVCDCPVCQAVDNDAFLDLIELDAATHNKVEDVELVIEQARHSPTNKVKVILMDEAHMLTQAASNKLLKILEEPPAHTLFLLATTEEYKILPTIRSRLKRRRFVMVSDNDLSKHITNIIKSLERSDITEEVIDYLVSSAQGSVRDAVRNLDTVLELNNPTLEEILASSGAASSEQILTLLWHIVNGEIGQSISVVEEFSRTGVDVVMLREGLEEFLQYLLYWHMDQSQLIPLQKERLKKFADKLSIDQTINLLDDLSYWRGRFTPYGKRNMVVSLIRYSQRNHTTGVTVGVDNPSQNNMAEFMQSIIGMFDGGKLNVKAEEIPTVNTNPMDALVNRALAEAGEEEEEDGHF